MKFTALLAVLVATAALAGHRDGGVHRRPPAGHCETASDCRGMLPQSCMVCGDGGSQCAHFTCVKNACEIVTCDAP